MLRHLLCASVKGIVISKYEVSDDGLIHLCNSLQTPEVEQPAVSPVSDGIPFWQLKGRHQSAWPRIAY